MGCSQHSKYPFVPMFDGCTTMFSQFCNQYYNQTIAHDFFNFHIAQLLAPLSSSCFLFLKRQHPYSFSVAVIIPSPQQLKGGKVCFSPQFQGPVHYEWSHGPRSLKQLLTLHPVRSREGSQLDDAQLTFTHSLTHTDTHTLTCGCVSAHTQLTHAHSSLMHTSILDQVKLIALTFTGF